MRSNAHREWVAVRSDRLDRLVKAHVAVRGRGRGRRWFTEELNHALITRLASEFQGFSRDLHDEVSAAVADQIMDPALRQITLTLLLSGRKLDTGNANWANLCNDFKSFGLDFAADVKVTAGAQRYKAYTAALQELNAARNAIAHQDAPKLMECNAATPLTLSTFRRWRAQLNKAAIDMDQTSGAYLRKLTGSDPWH